MGGSTFSETKHTRNKDKSLSTTGPFLGNLVLVSQHQIPTMTHLLQDTENYVMIPQVVVVEESTMERCVRIPQKEEEKTEHYVAIPSLHNTTNMDYPSQQELVQQAIQAMQTSFMQQLQKLQTDMHAEHQRQLQEMQQRLHHLRQPRSFCSSLDRSR